jgi:hypothetical protein
MNYCALDDAFQTIGSAPSPGCTTDYATKAARKEERRKARRCKGPLATYLDVGDKDPDRQQLNKLPDVPAMNPATGLRQHVPADAPVGSLEPFVPRNDDDLQGDYVRAELPIAGLNVPGTTEQQKSCPGRKKWFGADADGEAFADYVPDVQNYRLQPDFLTAFEHAGVAKAGSTSSLPNPSVNMFWKPLTPSGAQTSFIEHLPPPGGQYYNPPTHLNGETSNEDIMKKLDKLWARLDDMSTSSPEQVTSELLMFISSGIFVLFMMDLLVKKGSTLRF